MINIIFKKDYNNDFNIKIDGLVIVDITYNNGKLFKVKEITENYYGSFFNETTKEIKLEEFKNHYNIQSEDMITVLDMLFADFFNKEYIGKGIFDKEND